MKYCIIYLAERSAINQMAEQSKGDPKGNIPNQNEKENEKEKEQQKAELTECHYGGCHVSGKTYVCSRCKCARYCSRECQRKNNPIHSMFCTQMRDENLRSLYPSCDMKLISNMSYVRNVPFIHNILFMLDHIVTNENIKGSGENFTFKHRVIVNILIKHLESRVCDSKAERVINDNITMVMRDINDITDDFEKKMAVKQPESFNSEEYAKHINTKYARMIENSLGYTPYQSALILALASTYPDLR